MDKKILILLSLVVLIFSLGCTSPNAEGDRVVTQDRSMAVAELEASASLGRVGDHGVAMDECSRPAHKDAAGQPPRRVGDHDVPADSGCTLV